MYSASQFTLGAKWFVLYGPNSPPTQVISMQGGWKLYMFALVVCFFTILPWKGDRVGLVSQGKRLEVVPVDTIDLGGSQSDKSPGPLYSVLPL